MKINCAIVTSKQVFLLRQAKFQVGIRSAAIKAAAHQTWANGFLVEPAGVGPGARGVLQVVGDCCVHSFLFRQSRNESHL